MCYTIPAAGAIVTTILWNQSKDIRLWWLNLMFWGGALFGVIDHLWNGELFIFSPNILNDLTLGAVITASIFFSWKWLLRKSLSVPALASYLNAQTQAQEQNSIDKT